MTPADAPRIAWLSGVVARLLDVIGSEGEEARVVGGAVRNALLGEEPGDVDIATTARPEEVIRRVSAAGFKAVPTGVAHGTVTVVADGHPFEVTTLREDVETFGRHAVVRFGRDWAADAARRDFTMNALSVSADGTIHDYVDGLSDLRARRVRFIGDAHARIAEDYLRILRFFRFHAHYGHGDPDARGLHAAIAGRAGLARLSRERVRMELMKLLLAPGAVSTLQVMADTGLLGGVLGGVPLVASLERLIAIEARVGAAPCAVRRLGALAVLVVEDAERLFQRLRLTNAEHRRLVVMGEGWWRIAPHDMRAARGLLYRLGAQGYLDRVLLAAARAADADFSEALRLPQHFVAPAFPITAADLMQRGVPRGPLLGAGVKIAEDMWVAEDLPLDPSAVARIAQVAARQATAKR